MFQLYSRSTQDNVKLLDQLKSDLKRTINCNKYQSKVTIQQQNPYLNCLINPSFQEVNRLFILSFPDNAVRTGHIEYFIPSVEIKYYNVVIDGQKVFHPPVKNNIRTCANILRFTAVQGDDYTTCCLLFYPYFNEH